MRKYLPVFHFLLFFLFSCYAVHAQSLRWGASGGSADGSFGATDETVTDVATDPNGNVYVLSNVVGNTSLNVNGRSLTGYGSQDIVLSSFKCDGSYRWSKVLGGSDVDFPAALRTDAAGGVYVEGYFSTHYINIHLDTDTSWATGSSYKTLFIVKYDTGGHYKWLNMPQPDTAGAYSPSNVRALDMDVDSAGNVYAMFGLSPGAYAGGGYVVSTSGVDILKYNSAGIFQGGTPLQIKYDGTVNGGLRLKADASLGRYYVTGNLAYITNLTFNGSVVDMPLFIGAFSSTGNLLWQRHNSTGLGQGFGRVSIDAQHNIYLAGVSQAFSSPDTFNSSPVINTVSTHGNAPIIVKMDTAGNNTWVKNASSNHAVYSSSLALNGSYVTIAGSYNGQLVCSGLDSLFHPTAAGEGYDIFLLTLNASTGSFLKLDSISSSFADNEYATGIASDKHGNVYIGGDFSGGLFLNTDTLSNTGGGSDFFVAKYGYDNCGCTTTPVANYTHTGISPVNFTYTGTTTGVDSVVWNFGDGNAARGMAVSHSYSVAGTYWVCATAYSSCGSNTYCDSVMATTSVATITAFPNLKVYPNPFADMLTVENVTAGTQLTIYNLMGNVVYNVVLTNNKEQINTSKLLPGNYLLLLRDEKGEKGTMLLTK